MKKSDHYANEQFIGAIRQGTNSAGIVPEEMEDIVIFDDTISRASKYVCLFDPLDGSANIDVNISIGSIFSVYRRLSSSGEPPTIAYFLQPGIKQVAAGYVIYGSSTMLVYG